MATSRLERIGTIYSRVEGLLVRGAMKPDDRPLWFDVYRAFPPAVEPIFARQKPTEVPIRRIFYPEDNVRAKFHSAGHGIGTTNMLSLTGETTTKKLLSNYQKFHGENLPEDEMIKKSVLALKEEISQLKEERNTLKATSEKEGNTSNIKHVFDE